MSSKLIDWPSLAKALAIHVGIAMAFLIGWDASSEPVKTKEVPQHIKAVVVERPKPVKKSPPKKKVEKKKPVKKKAKPKPKKKPAPKKKPKPEVKKPEPKKKVEVKKPKGPSFEDLFAEEAKELKAEEKAEERKKEEAEKKRLADLKMQQELERQQAEQAERIASELDTYKSLIQQTMRKYWKKPPIARDDLAVILNIRLLPGGEVNGVSVSQTSGSKAFDRSALNAVNKAGRFSVPSDPAVFDRHFRSFKMRFSSNDLM